MPRNTSSIGTSRRAGAPTSPSSAATRRSPMPTCSNASTGSDRRCATGSRSARGTGRAVAPRRSGVHDQFLRVDQDRRGADSTQHPVEGRRLPSCARRLGRPNGRRQSRTSSGAREDSAVRSAGPAACRGRRSGRRVRRAAPARIVVARRAGREPRCTRVLAVLVGEHGSPERVRAPAARHVRLRRALREGRARPHRGGSLLQRPKLFFAYGLGNAGYFPLAVGATSILWPGPPQPAHVFATIERYRPTLVLLGADWLCDAAGA